MWSSERPSVGASAGSCARERQFDTGHVGGVEVAALPHRGPEVLDVPRLRFERRGQPEVHVVHADRHRKRVILQQLDADVVRSGDEGLPGVVLLHLQAEWCDARQGVSHALHVEAEMVHHRAHAPAGVHVAGAEVHVGAGKSDLCSVPFCVGSPPSSRKNCRMASTSRAKTCTWPMATPVALGATSWAAAGVGHDR